MTANDSTRKERLLKRGYTLEKIEKVFNSQMSQEIRLELQVNYPRPKGRELATVYLSILIIIFDTTQGSTFVIHEYKFSITSSTSSLRFVLLQ